MSIYAAGVDAQRETVKWLVAFVPSAAIVAIAGTLLVETRHREPGPLASWADEAVLPLVALAIALAGTVAIIAAGARVLSAQPADLTTTITDTARLSEAFAAGVGAPHFTSSTDFAAAMGALAAAWTSGSAPDEQHVTRAEAATEALRAWVLHRAVSERFRGFVVWFCLGAVMIVGGLAVAHASWPAPAARFTTPTEVDFAIVDEEGFQEATGCDRSEDTTAIAVGGSWDDPVLELHGPGCTFDDRWHPAPEDIQLRPAAG
jgi:hypothetical protein